MDHIVHQVAKSQTRLSDFHFRDSLTAQSVKKSACNTGDLGLIPGWERSPGEGNGNPLQYSCVEKPMDRGDWWATVHGIPGVTHDLVNKTQPLPSEARMNLNNNSNINGHISNAY